MMGQKYTKSCDKSVGKNKKTNIPSWFDAREDASFPNILSKGELDLDSSAENALSNAMRYWLRKLNKQEFQPSRLYMYYFARKNTKKPSLKTLLKSIRKYGVCSEKTWPYVEGNILKEPSAEAQTEAQKYKNIDYFRVKNKTNDIKVASSYDYPIVFEMNVYPSFTNENVAKTGMIPLPGKDERVVDKQTCIIVGFRDSIECFICANSLGKEWGERGFFYLPYEYVEEHCCDLYAINSIV